MPLVSVQDNEFSTLDVADFDDGLAFGNRDGGGGRDGREDGGGGSQSVSTMKRGARDRGAGTVQQAQRTGQWNEFGEQVPPPRPSFSGQQQMLDAADVFDDMSVMTLDTALQDMDMTGNNMGHMAASMAMNTGGGSGRSSSFASVGLGGTGHNHTAGGGGSHDGRSASNVHQQRHSGHGSQAGESSNWGGGRPVPPVHEGEQVLNWGDASDSQRGPSGGAPPRLSGHHSNNSPLTDDNEQSEERGGGSPLDSSVAQSDGGAADPPGPLPRNGRGKSQTRSAQASAAAGSGNKESMDLEMKAAHLNFKLAQARSSIDTLQLRNRKLAEERDEFKSKYEGVLEKTEELSRRLDEALRKNETDRMKDRMAAARGQRRRSSTLHSSAGSLYGSETGSDDGGGDRLTKSAPPMQGQAPVHRFTRRPSVDPSGDPYDSSSSEERDHRAVKQRSRSSARRRESTGDEPGKVDRPEAARPEQARTKRGRTDAAGAMIGDDKASAPALRNAPLSPSTAEASPGEPASPRTPVGLLGGVLHGFSQANNNKSKKTPKEILNQSQSSDCCAASVSGGASIATTATKKQHNRGTANGGGGDDDAKKGGGGWFSGGAKKVDPRDEVWDDDPFSTFAPREEQQAPSANSDSAGSGRGASQGTDGGGRGWLGKAFGRHRRRRSSVGTSLSADEDDGDWAQREGDDPVQK